MDLIYTDEKRNDVGALDDYTLDLAYGEDENNFECAVNLESDCCPISSVLYIEGTEYGGIIDGQRVDTENDKLVYLGRTWHGVLEGHILEPDSGQDYLVLSGDANTVLETIISRCGLGELFQANTASSEITISNYKMNRYIGAYEGIRKMLYANGGKLNMKYSDKKVILSAVPLIDYSEDEEFDSSQFDFVVEKNIRPANHVICLGRGELKEREVIHLYCDESGNISTTQTQFGEDEVTIKYDCSNAESTEELEQGGREELEKAWGDAESCDIDFENSDTCDYDIGDIVGAREEHTGIFISRPINKKIVKINKDGISVKCQIGE